ncbi:MAG: transposase domain-containing protein [Verrucomicrobiota bacterium]|nr:transposase domain-containing protein [Verrucomicrobiota bacterium]
MVASSPTTHNLAQGAQAATALITWMASGVVPEGYSKATLYRYRQLVTGRPRHEWPAILMPRHLGRTALAEIPQPAWDYYAGLYMHKLAPASTECYRRTVKEAARLGWGELPSLDTFRRRIASTFNDSEIILAREGEEALFRLYPAQERTVVGLAPLQWLNADGLRLDVFCRFQDGTIGRPHLWTWQDVYTRMPLAWVLDFAENTCQIRRSFGMVIEQYGLWCGPDGPHIVIDNTRGAANKTMTGGIAHRHRFGFVEGEAKGILAQFGCQVHWTTIDPWGGRGQAKPIERLHREMQQKISKSPECWGAYTGNNTTAKPEDYATRAVSEATLRAVIDREMKSIQEQMGRRNETANGGSMLDTFNSAYAAAQAAGHIRPVAEHERRLFLLAQIQRRASAQDGAITFNGNRYWSTELVNHRGTDVILRYDPDDLQQDSWVYQLDGTLIGPARCIAATGFGDATAAREHERARTQFRKATKAALQAKLKLSPADLASSTNLPDTITRDDLDKATVLPRSAEAEESDGIDVWDLARKAAQRHDKTA